MPWKSNFEMVYIHAHLLFNSSHFLHPLYLKHFVYFIALVHICYTKSVFSFEVLQQSDAGTCFLCVSQYRVMYHFVLQSPYLYMTTNMFCICIVLIWVLWVSFIFDLTISLVQHALGWLQGFFPACIFFTFLQWYICQQTTMCCWMLLENSPWGFSFFFICTSSIKLVIAVAFLSIIIPASIFNHSFSYVDYQFRICITLSLRILRLQWFKKPHREVTCFSNCGF